MKKYKLIIILSFVAIIFSFSSVTVTDASSLVSKQKSNFIARIPFFPVRGNHEKQSDVSYINNYIFPAYKNKIHRMNNHSMNYYVDWKNIRLIIIDQFSEFSRASDNGFFAWLMPNNGNINDSGRKWTESVINSAGNTINHIFIAFHEPAFPRGRHIHDSFDKYPINRNKFWNMLMQHNKVRAVFVGHTHYYSRMRVNNPSSMGDTGLPNQKGGIFQIDCGTTGREKYNNTIVEINIKGNNVLFRTIQAKNGTADFQVIDQWQLNENLNSKDKTGWSFAFIGDNRDGFLSYKKNLEEIRDLTVNPKPLFNSMEFILSGGDMDPVKENYENIYLKVFGLQK